MFYVTATNFVGTSQPSVVSTFYTCQRPSGLSPPNLSLITKTSIKVSWHCPLDDGGCPITSYSILRDGGPGDATMVEVHAADVNNQPTLTSFSVSDLPAGSVGLPVKFSIRALNLGGFSITSIATTAIIADVPEKPASVIVVQAETSTT
jgi:hypothetical protein